MAKECDICLNTKKSVEESVEQISKLLKIISDKDRFMKKYQ